MLLTSSTRPPTVCRRRSPFWIHSKGGTRSSELGCTPACDHWTVYTELLAAVHWQCVPSPRPQMRAGQLLASGTNWGFCAGILGIFELLGSICLPIKGLARPIGLIPSPEAVRFVSRNSSGPKPGKPHHTGTLAAFRKIRNSLAPQTQNP